MNLIVQLADQFDVSIESMMEVIESDLIELTKNRDKYSRYKQRMKKRRVWEQFCEDCADKDTCDKNFEKCPYKEDFYEQYNKDNEDDR